MKHFCLLFLSILYFSCSQNTAIQEELNTANKTIEQQEELLDSLQTILTKEDKKKLVHIVYLKLKEDHKEEDMSTVLSEIQKLETIPVLNNLEYGQFQDLGDQRAMSDYHIVMQMDFKSEDDYRTYQEHPTHLALRGMLGKFLGGPPVTYDFWTE